MSRAKPPRAPSSDRSSATASAPVPSDARNLDAFVDAAQRAPVPATHTTHRLIFAMDATASRQPTWDMACNLHTTLFNEADRLGNVAIQLCFYRGYNELRASRWATTPDALRDKMLRVSCQGGATQITRLLKHVGKQAANHPLRALIFIGDCFEEDEDEMLAAAGQLALRNVPVFIFQEGHDPTAARAFAGLARLTRGAVMPFAPGSSHQLRDLLSAAVAYATGGRSALERVAKIGHGSANGSAADRLLAQLPAL